MKNISEGDIVIWNGKIGVVNSYDRKMRQFNVHFNDLNRSLLIHPNDMIKAENIDMEGQILRSKSLSPNSSFSNSPSSSFDGIESKNGHGNQRPVSMNRRSSDSNLNYSNRNHRNDNVGSGNNTLNRPASVNRIFSEPRIHKNTPTLSRPSSVRDLSEPKLQIKKRKCHFQLEPIILNKIEFIPLPPNSIYEEGGIRQALKPRVLEVIKPESLVSILKKPPPGDANSLNYDTKLEIIKMNRLKDKSKSFSESTHSGGNTQLRNSLSTVPIINSFIKKPSEGRVTKHSIQASFSRKENLKHMGEDYDVATLLNTRKNAIVAKPSKDQKSTHRMFKAELKKIRMKSPPPSRQEQRAATINSSYINTNPANKRVGGSRNSGYGNNNGNTGVSATGGSKRAVRPSLSIDREVDRYAAMHRALSPLSSDIIGRGSSV